MGRQSGFFNVEATYHPLFIGGAFVAAGGALVGAIVRALFLLVRFAAETGLGWACCGVSAAKKPLRSALEGLAGS